MVEIQADPPRLAAPGYVTLTFTVTNQSQTQSAYNLTFFRDGVQLCVLGLISPKHTRTITARVQIAGADIERSFLIDYAWYEGVNPTNENHYAASKEIAIYRDRENTATDFTLDRVITPTVITRGVPVGGTYTLTNTGFTTLKNVIVTDTELGVDWRIDELAPGGVSTHEIAPFTTEIDVVSKPTMYYMVEGDPTAKESGLPSLKIEMARPPSLDFHLTADPPVVVAGANSTIVITLKNDGAAPLRDVRITCDELSEKFDEIPSLGSGSKTVERKIIAMSSKTYHFVVTARDAEGKEIPPITKEIGIPVVGAVDRPAGLAAEVTASVPQMTAPGDVEINVTVKNNGEDTLYNVVIADATLGVIGSLDQLPAHAERLIRHAVRLEETAEFRISATANLKDALPVTVSAEILRIPMRSAAAASAASPGRRTASASPTASAPESVVLVTAPPPLPAISADHGDVDAVQMASPLTEPTPAPALGGSGMIQMPAAVSEQTISWMKWGLILMTALALACAVTLATVWRRGRRARRYR